MLGAGCAPAGGPAMPSIGPIQKRCLRRSRRSAPARAPRPSTAAISISRDGAASLVCVGAEHQADALGTPGDSAVGFDFMRLAGPHVEVGNPEGIGRSAGAAAVGQRIELLVGI